MATTNVTLLHHGEFHIFLSIDTIFFGLLTIVLFALFVFHRGIFRRNTTDVGKNKTPNNGNGGVVECLLVLLAVCTNYITAISVLGFPGEIYSYNTMLMEVGLSVVIFVPLGAALFYPIFYRLKLPTIFQYLELRFDSRNLRFLSSLTFIIEAVMLLGVLLWASAVALAIAVGLDFQICVAVVGLCALFYTFAQGRGQGTTGGWWVDLLQTMVLLGFIVAVISSGVSNAGGIEYVMEQGNLRNAVRNWDFRLAPFIRRTTLNIVIGQGFMWASIFVCQQPQVQRYIALPSLTKSMLCLIASAVIIAAAIDTSCFAGLIMYVNYFDCDPVKLGVLKRPDQMLLYYIADNFGPGLLGVFVAFVWRSSLSGIAIGVHGLAMLTTKEFLQFSACFKNLTSEKQCTVRNFLACGLCVCVTCFALIAGHLGTFVGAFFNIVGVFGGPLLGLFLLGLIVPFANKLGAATGLLAGLAVNLSVIIGTQVYGISYRTVPTTIEDCNFDNYTKHLLPHQYFPKPTPKSMPFSQDYYNVPVAYYHEKYVDVSDGKEKEEEIPQYVTDFPEKWYTLSYAIYALIGCAVTFGIGIALSLLTAWIPSLQVSKPDEVKQYLHPAVVRIKQFLTCPVRRNTYTVNT